MRRLITLVFTVFLTTTLFGQHLEYENSSKWFFGVNAGAAWNTTDVKKKTDYGWGFTLGRSFNYGYGRGISWDLRARYLRGFWYGQDYDTTNLAHLGSDYTGALQGYQNDPGYTVNNFQADVHHLGLELALHFNRFRDRTGWDPYIFGGVNLVWNETYGNLTNNDALNAPLGNYDYDSIAVDKPSINGLMDNSYDTPLDGSTDRYDVDFMPSLGFGIGYNFGPRFSLGLEHKTTFTRQDQFDGYVDNTPRFFGLTNDVYHYTSAYMRFRFRGRTRPTSPPIVEEPCQIPIVRITR